MSKHPNASEETAAMQRGEAMDDRPQDRYAGRRKFTGCHRCGSIDGMQIVHRETLENMSIFVIGLVRDWHRLPDSDDNELFCPCRFCNRDRVIPSGYEPVNLLTVQDWLNRDPMAPDYAAPAAEEPVLASEDSHDAAGL